MSDVRVYSLFTIPDCNYCQMAVQLVQDRQLIYIVEELHPESDKLKILKEQHNWTTAPMIFQLDGQNEVFIGGYTDLVDFLGQ